MRFAACFGIAGLFGVFATAAMAGGVLAEAWDFRAVPSKQLAAVTGWGLAAFACLRTYRLLLQRRRQGVFLASTCLAGLFVAELGAGSHHGRLNLVPLIGLALLASVWRRLE